MDKDSIHWQFLGGSESHSICSLDMQLDHPDYLQQIVGELNVYQRFDNGASHHGDYELFTILDSEVFKQQLLEYAKKTGADCGPLPEVNETPCVQVSASASSGSFQDIPVKVNLQHLILRMGAAGTNSRIQANLNQLDRGSSLTVSYDWIDEHYSVSDRQAYAAQYHAYRAALAADEDDFAEQKEAITPASDEEINDLLASVKLALESAGVAPEVVVEVLTTAEEAHGNEWGL